MKFYDVPIKLLQYRVIYMQKSRNLTEMRRDDLIKINLLIRTSYAASRMRKVLALIMNPIFFLAFLQL